MEKIFYEPGRIATIGLWLRRTLQRTVILLSVFVIVLFSCNETSVQKKKPQASVAEAKLKPSIIEIISKGKSSDVLKLKQVVSELHIDSSRLYRWKNHLVILDTLSNKTNIISKLVAALSKDEVKLYDTAFYQFDRSYCDRYNIEKEWDHVLLTANLVKDTSLQNEYLAYHATQFQKWPEVAKGFCNASFQQLLVYKNGRQLMLVISIPKGKTLDELNPKTTQNNPGVTDWNKLMKRYQEGIEGTAPGETWVFLKPTSNFKL